MLSAPARQRSSIPERIGKYEIRGELGRGGFGQVFLGFDPTVGRQVAIKVLSADGDPNSLPRFRTEAIAAGKLNHKNIVTIHEFGEDRGTFYIAMEYLEGRDLQHVIRSGDSLSLLEKVRIMSQAADGLHCAHQNGIVHRDVKPANIMVLDDGSVKVMDFGIARLTRDDSRRLTNTGFLIGSVFYMAPEQLSGKEVDARCDIWAFGTIYYELICGRHPFEAPDTAAAMFRIVQREPAPIQRVCPECPDALTAVITRLLSKDPDSRYQSFEDVLFDTAPILLDLESRQANQLASQADELRRAGNLDEAQSLVKRILAVDPAHEHGRALWQQLHAELRHRSVRIRARSLIEQSEKAAAARDFSAAIEAVESAVRMDPGDTSLPARLAELRAARQRADLAAGLVASACESLQQNNLSAAFRLLGDALTAEPGNSEAQRLMTDVQDRISERNTEKRLRDGLTKVKGLLALQSFDEAIEILEDLVRQTPTSEQVRGALDLARQQREEYNCQRLTQSELDAAKNEIKSSQFEAAIARLELLAKESLVQNNVAGLLAYARGELETSQRMAEIKAAGAEAWRHCKALEFDQAITQVDAALVTFPDDPTLLRLRQAIVTELAKHQRVQLIQQALDESAQFERNGRGDQACVTLERALLRYPTESALANALARTQQNLAQQKERVYQAALERDLRQADTLIVQGQILQATQLVAQMKAVYPGEPGVILLLSRVQADEQRRAAWEALRAEAQRYLDAGQPDQAGEVVARARKEFGQDPQLIVLEAAAETMRARKGDLDRARAAFRGRDWRLAAVTLEKLLQQDAQDAEVRTLLNQVLEQERADLRQQRRDIGRMEAEKLILGLRFQEAVRCLRQLQQEFPDDDAIRDDLSRALDALDRQSRRETYAQGRNRADAFLKAGQFQAAVDTLEELIRQLPDDTILKEELKAASEARREHSRRERYATGRRRAAELIQAHKLDDAISLLQSLLVDFPGDAALEEDRKSALGARELQEHRQRLNHEIAQLEKLYRRGDARAVRERASSLSSDLQDARVRELLDWAASEIERSSQESEREPADSLRRKRNRRIIIGVFVAVSVASAAIPIMLALRPHVVPESLTADRAQLTFSFPPGAAASSQTLSIDGSAAGVNWSAAASDDWLSVEPNRGITRAQPRVSVDPSRLAPGSYSAYVIFTSADGIARARTNVKVVVSTGSASLGSAAAVPSPETKSQAAIKVASHESVEGKAETISTETTRTPSHSQSEVASSPPKQEVHPPPSLPIADCGPSYQLPKSGILYWSNGVLEKGGILVIGGPEENLAGGRVRGDLPGCEVDIRTSTDGIVIDEWPSRPDAFRRVKLRNSSPTPISSIELRWKIK